MNTNYIYNINIDNTMQLYYYEVLKKKINLINYYLDKSINSLNNIDGKFEKYYTIDGVNFNKTKIETIKDELYSRMNYLQNTVLPSIEVKINNLK